MTDQFFITLPSTASSEIYANNTQSHFRVKLPQAIELKGQWRLGLSEVHIPVIFDNIDEKTDSFNIYIEDSGPKPIKFINIPSFEFEGKGWEPQLAFTRHVIQQIPEELRHVINFGEANEGGTLTVQSGFEVKFSDDLKEMFGVMKGDDSLQVHKMIFPNGDYILSHQGEDLWLKIISPATAKKIKLKIPHGSYTETDEVLQAMTETIPEEHQRQVHFQKNRDGTVTITCKPHIRVKFPTSNHGLGSLLGFEETKSPLPTPVKGKYSVDLKRGIYGCYLYCNLIQPHVVGDVFAPLLRIIPLQDVDKNTSTYVKIYNSPDFYPIMQNRFETIEIDIRSDFGQRFKFRNGKTLVKLSFQKV